MKLNIKAILVVCQNLEKQKRLFGDVLQNKCSQKFSKLHRKTPMRKSPFNKLY